jgi:hypothetical protein
MMAAEIIYIRSQLSASIEINLKDEAGISGKRRESLKILVVLKLV